MSFFPPPPKLKTNVEDKAALGLTDDETTFLLNQYLREDQRQDTTLLRFIYKYLECRSSSQAAREVGWISQKGYYTVNKPEIRGFINAVTDKMMTKYGYDAHEVVERVKEIVQLDPGIFENPDGTFKTSLMQIPPEARRAIKKFKCKNIYENDPNGIPRVTGQLIEVELWDKMRATELLGREKNIFKETKVHQHDVTANMADVLLESKRRADERALALPAVIDITPEGEKGEG